MARSAQGNTPVAPNEHISTLRFLMIALPVQCAVSLYMLINYIVSNRYFSPFQSFFAVQAWGSILVVLLLGCVAVRAFLMLRCLQRVEHARIVLAQDVFRWPGGTPGREAAAGVAEVFSIETRMNGTYILIVAIFVVGYITFAPIGMNFFPLSLLFALPLDGFLILVAVSLWMSRNTIEITHEACILRSRGIGRWGASGQRIAWSDVRLFACYTFPNFLGRDVVQYELSSQRERISWRRIADGSSAAFSLSQPVSPREVYQHQMRLLPALITEKTGLPLCDVDEFP